MTEPLNPRDEDIVFISQYENGQTSVLCVLGISHPALCMACLAEVGSAPVLHRAQLPGDEHTEHDAKRVLGDPEHMSSRTPRSIGSRAGPLTQLALGAYESPPK